jgi:two-component system sensor histidine kinase KdpD
VQETVPDEVLQQADEIELIDLPPEELIHRLREGKVYMPQQVGRALENFFTKGNLTALRELALRTAASRVDADMLTYMQANAVKGPGRPRRLLVCVNRPRWQGCARRQAHSRPDAHPWIIATVCTRHEALGEMRGVPQRTRWTGGDARRGGRHAAFGPTSPPNCWISRGRAM